MAATPRPKKPVSPPPAYHSGSSSRSSQGSFPLVSPPGYNSGQSTASAAARARYGLSEPPSYRTESQSPYTGRPYNQWPRLYGGAYSRPLERLAPNTPTHPHRPGNHRADSSPPGLRHLSATTSASKAKQQAARSR